jgi:hypothetical protein
VRHGLLHLTLDVPTDDQLLDWANTVHKTLSGHVTFFEDDRRTARETVNFAAGQCVSYQESFVYGKMRNADWHNAHLGPGGGGFDGYWCREAAGVAVDFDHEDTSFQQP